MRETERDPGEGGREGGRGREREAERERESERTELSDVQLD